jgi:uncharacterized membrane protein YczE
MVNFIKRFIKLMVGLFLYSLGIVITMKANIGFASWEVFHKGISNISGISIGQVSIIVGLIICGVVLLMGEKLGVGTILNMLFIGIFIDLLIDLNFIPGVNTYTAGIIMLLAGILIIAFATYFYIDSSFGAGPRDSLMVAVERKTGLEVGVARGIIEVSVVFIGWLLGGPVGLGTILAAISFGFFIQLVFKLMNFDAAEIEHETFTQTVKNLIE